LMKRIISTSVWNRTRIFQLFCLVTTPTEATGWRLSET
jgi:hypothetical protein